MTSILIPYQQIKIDVINVLCTLVSMVILVSRNFFHSEYIALNRNLLPGYGNPVIGRVYEQSLVASQTFGTLKSLNYGQPCLKPVR